VIGDQAKWCSAMPSLEGAQQGPTGIQLQCRNLQQAWGETGRDHQWHILVQAFALENHLVKRVLGKEMCETQLDFLSSVELEW